MVTNHLLPLPLSHTHTLLVDLAPPTGSDILKALDMAGSSTDTRTSQMVPGANDCTEEVVQKSLPSGGSHRVQHTHTHTHTHTHIRTQHIVITHMHTYTHALVYTHTHIATHNMYSPTCNVLLGERIHLTSIINSYSYSYPG